MTQSFWEPGTVEETKQEEQQTKLEEQQPKPIEQARPQLVQAAEPVTVALSVDEFSALEERILRAVNLVKRERLARAEADERAAQLETQLREQAPLADRLQMEVKSLRTERDHVRQRVERLLAQLDALEL